MHAFARLAVLVAAVALGVLRGSVRSGRVGAVARTWAQAAGLRDAAADATSAGPAAAAAAVAVASGAAAAGAPPVLLLASPLVAGERAHFFTPPSDMEQVRKGARPRHEHDVIPYPNDPPHTFPAIKARQLFTRSPRRVRTVITDSSASNSRLAGAVPFVQREERFRTIYEGSRNSDIDVVLGGVPPEQLAEWTLPPSPSSSSSSSAAAAAAAAAQQLARPRAADAAGAAASVADAGAALPAGVRSLDFHGADAHRSPDVFRPEPVRGADSDGVVRDRYMR